MGLPVYLSKVVGNQITKLTRVCRQINCLQMKKMATLEGVPRPFERSIIHFPHRLVPAVGELVYKRVARRRRNDRLHRLNIGEKTKRHNNFRSGSKNGKSRGGLEWEGGGIEGSARLDPGRTKAM